jgi:predicted NUDIX family phosphoesterase
MEFVYVVKRYDLFNLHFPHGFVTGQEANGGWARDVLLQRIRERGFFLERRKAEEDSGFKQIIPYCIVRHNGDVLMLKRLPTQGEKRLHNKMSIGVGGHINPVDGEGDLLDLGCERELAEEVEIPGRHKKRVVGFINDDATAVGSVHFGVVYRVDLADREVSVREKAMMEGALTPVSEVKQLAAGGADFETWSALAMARIDTILQD